MLVWPAHGIWAGIGWGWVGVRGACSLHGGDSCRWLAVPIAQWLLVSAVGRADCTAVTRVGVVARVGGWSCRLHGGYSCRWLVVPIAQWLLGSAVGRADCTVVTRVGA
eukprot:363067-Chlamydomonas_euryale.AAC.2